MRDGHEKARRIRAGFSAESGDRRLLGDTELCAPILRPSGFVGTLSSRHFRPEAHCLDSVVPDTLREERLANGLCAPFTESAIVLWGAALVGEPRDDHGFAFLQRLRNLSDFGLFRARYRETVEAEVHWLEPRAVDVSSEERGPLLSRGERGADPSSCSVDVGAGDAVRVAGPRSGVQFLLLSESLTGGER